jgi:hypothetical protein
VILPLLGKQEHARARLFKRYGVLCVEFYDSDLCRASLQQVIDDFLTILARHG